jgi:hypothetical protein
MRTPNLPSSTLLGSPAAFRGQDPVYYYNLFILDPPAMEYYTLHTTQLPSTAVVSVYCFMLLSQTAFEHLSNANTEDSKSKNIKAIPVTGCGGPQAYKVVRH